MYWRPNLQIVSNEPDTSFLWSSILIRVVTQAQKLTAFIVWCFIVQQTSGQFGLLYIYIYPAAPVQVYVYKYGTMKLYYLAPLELGELNSDYMAEPKVKSYSLGYYKMPDYNTQTQYLLSRW